MLCPRKKNKCYFYLSERTENPNTDTSTEKKSVKKQGESYRLCVQMLLNIHKEISANYIYWLAESPRCN